MPRKELRLDFKQTSVGSITAGPRRFFFILDSFRTGRYFKSIRAVLEVTYFEHMSSDEDLQSVTGHLGQAYPYGSVSNIESSDEGRA